MLVPAGTAAQEEWPTADELRADLQSIGFTFGFGTIFGSEFDDAPLWLGGRPRQSNIAVPPIRFIAGEPMIIEVWGVSTSASLSTWPNNVRSNATALMEVLARIPGDDTAVAQRIAEGGQGCDVFEVPGGQVTVDGTDWRRNSDFYDVTIVQGGTSPCPSTTD
jgi:hypothetical protein